MNQAYFDRWSDIAKKFQEPFHAMAELNMKTLQNLSYIKPEELTQVKKPEEIWEKHISLLIDNGHITLDYMQKSFQIMEKTMLSMVQEVKTKAEAVNKKH